MNDNEIDVTKQKREVLVVLCCCGARVTDPVPDTARNSLITSDINPLRN